MSPRKKKDQPSGDDEVLRDAEGDPVEDPTLSGILPPLPEAHGGPGSTHVTPGGSDQPTVVAREWRPPSPEQPEEPEEPLEPAPLGEQEPEEPPAPEPEPEPEPVAVEPEPEPLPPEPEPEPVAAEPLPEPEPVSETFVEPSYEPAYEPAYEPSHEPAYEPSYEPAAAAAAPGPSLTERPEVLIGAAFAGGIVLAIIIRRLGR
jgi:hypothetical protein